MQALFFVDITPEGCESKKVTTFSLGCNPLVPLDLLVLAARSRTINVRGNRKRRRQTLVDLGEVSTFKNRWGGVVASPFIFAESLVLKRSMFSLLTLIFLLDIVLAQETAVSGMPTIEVDAFTRLEKR